MATGDVLPHVADLVGIVDAIGSLGVLIFDVEIEVAAEGGGGESVTAEGTGLVLDCRSFGRRS